MSLLAVLAAFVAWQKLNHDQAERWQHTASLAQLTDAARHDTGNAGLHWQLGARQREVGQLVQAAQSFQRAVELQPGNEDYWHDWATTVGLARGAAAQLLVFASWQKALPQSGRVRAEEAQVHYLAGNYALSEKLAREATQFSPERADGWQVLGQLALVRQDLPAAEIAFRQAMGKDSADWQSSLGLVKVALQKADSARAVQEAREMIARAPGEPVAQLYLAQALLKKPQDSHRVAELAEARKLLTSALAQTPGLVEESRFDAYVALGDSYAEQDDWANALVAFEQARALAPGSVKLQVRLARAYRQTGQKEKENIARQQYQASASYQEAVQTLRLQIASFPKNGDLQLKLARLYAEHGNYVDASRILQQMIAQNIQADDARREYAALRKKMRL